MGFFLTPKHTKAAVMILVAPEKNHYCGFLDLRCQDSCRSREESQKTVLPDPHAQSIHHSQLLPDSVFQNSCQVPKIPQIPRNTIIPFQIEFPSQCDIHPLCFVMLTLPLAPEGRPMVAQRFSAGYPLTKRAQVPEGRLKSRGTSVPSPALPPAGRADRPPLAVAEC
jgi:hypothetical protein